jgi:hypothetical protein
LVPTPTAVIASGSEAIGPGRSRNSHAGLLRFARNNGGGRFQQMIPSSFIAE